MYRELLKRTIEVDRLGLAELDPEGNFRSANHAFVNMLGVCEQDLVGRHWSITVAPADHVFVEEAHHTARANGRAYLDIRAVRGDGSTIHQALTLTADFGDSGAVTGYRCLRQELPGYDRGQEALKLVVESAPNGLLMLDADGRIQLANHAVEKLFGYERRDLVGRMVETLLPERFRTRHQSHRHAFSSSQSNMAMAGRDLCGLRQDGVEIPLQVYLNRIETGAGELILCTIIDIAERLRYEQQLKLATLAAEAANRAKSDFLARMSHEIRTPMNLIMGMNALLLESPLNEKQRQHVEISYRNVRRLLRLINGILDLSKVEAGKVTLEAAPFDLGEVLEECAATLASATEQKGLEFAVSIDPETWLYWRGDAERLQQILLNLIGNSVKFTTRGRVQVRVLPENCPGGEPGLRFEVSDTGCGVPEDKADIIFEAFQQAEGAMNRPYEGTGLGLSIAQTLVRLMEGRIWIERKSEPGAKFVFTAFFPRASRDDVHRHLARDASALGGWAVEDGTRILVAEDNPENVILLRAYLDNLPLSLDFAANGREALEKRKTGEYDLVLMDVQMPLMDGYSATREIRAWEAACGVPAVPIVALTAHALSGAWGESMEAGCTGHLTKPVERGDLIEAIGRYARAHPAPPVEDPIAALRPAFLSNRREELPRLREALSAGDFRTLQHIGHNCKGTGTGYGFPEISRAGSAIESAAKDRDPSRLAEAIDGFERCVLEHSR